MNAGMNAGQVLPESWVDVPGVVADGRAVHRHGGTDVPGLSVVGHTVTVR